MHCLRLKIGFTLGVVAIQLCRAQAGETNYPANETWESISNRWGMVPYETAKQKAEQGDATAQYFIAWAFWDGTNKDEAIKLFKSAADKNLAAAQNRLGYMYQHGWGLETNYSKAIEWYLKSAAQGYANAEYNVGVMYCEGIGTTSDYVAGVKYIKLAADQGNPPAQNYLGYLYGKGLGVPKDLDESVKYYQMAASSGLAQARMNMGYALEHGEGIQQDYVEAAKYYRLAAEQGHAMAQNNLGHFYYWGTGVNQDANEAMKWYQKSADQGEVYGMSNLGWMYEHGNGVEHNHDLALKWTKAAAEKGFAKSQLQMGDLLEYQFDTNNVWIPDHDGAMDWYRKAALQGVVEAMMKLGDLYFHQNAYDDILQWYGMAVTNGNMEAADKLGDLYWVNRPNHPENHVEAARWYRMAAEKDDGYAQYQLGCLLLDGKDIPHDPVEGEAWLKKSVDNGYSEAALRIASLHNLPSTSVLTNISRGDLVVASFNGDGKTRLTLGIAYEEGIGGEKDLLGALNAYCWILDLGPYGDEPEALRRMINLYATGQIRPEPMAQPTNNEQQIAFGYAYVDAPKDKNMLAGFLKGYRSQIKSPEALYQVGEMFYDGVGVSVDKGQALEWFTLAAKAGNFEAQKRLEQINK